MLGLESWSMNFGSSSTTMVDFQNDDDDDDDCLNNIIFLLWNVAKHVIGRVVTLYPTQNEPVRAHQWDLVLSKWDLTPLCPLVLGPTRRGLQHCQGKGKVPRGETCLRKQSQFTEWDRFSIEQILITLVPLFLIFPGTMSTSVLFR